MTSEEQRGAIPALVLATVAFAVCFMVWGLIAPLTPTFRDLYGLSSTQVGLLVAVPVVLGSLARLPLGILTDKYGGRLIFSLLMLALVPPVILAGLTGSFGTLVAVSFLLGVAGASFAVGVPFVSRWFPPERQGFALGIYGMGNIGTAFANFGAPRIADAESWRWAFFVFPPLLMGVVQDVTGSYAIGYMLLSEFALVCLLINVLVIQRRATLLHPPGE